MEQIKEQIEQLERQIFGIEMDDYAYTNGRAQQIPALEEQIENLKKQLARA